MAYNDPDETLAFGGVICELNGENQLLELYLIQCTDFDKFHSMSLDRSLRQFWWINPNTDVAPSLSLTNNVHRRSNLDLDLLYSTGFGTILIKEISKTSNQ